MIAWKHNPFFDTLSAGDYSMTDLYELMKPEIQEKSAVVRRIATLEPSCIILEYRQGFKYMEKFLIWEGIHIYKRRVLLQELKKHEGR